MYIINLGTILLANTGPLIGPMINYHVINYKN